MPYHGSPRYQPGDKDAVVNGKAAERPSHCSVFCTCLAEDNDACPTGALPIGQPEVVTTACRCSNLLRAQIRIVGEMRL